MRWGAAPPHSAVNVVRRHVGSLRRLLEPGLPARAAGRRLLRDAGGYRLPTDGDSSDPPRFRALRDEGRRLAERSPARALELLTEALSLGRGPIADGLPAQVRTHPAFDAVDRERLAALREAANAALRAKTPGAVLPELRQATARHPLDEPLQAALVAALAAAGHRSAALVAYETVRAWLAEVLGIDPGPELRSARDTVLRGTPLTGATEVADMGADAGATSTSSDEPHGPAGPLTALPPPRPTARSARCSPGTP
ncbi:BTAD domain-containing putative transcriptional regulator [Streptomyces sp. ME18-1-4]|nr:BTAD domain-containing putative transcriptional regulator [Streptomyces sp. ME18-1-4]